MAREKQRVELKNCEIDHEGAGLRVKGKSRDRPEQHTKAGRDILSSVKQNSIDM